MDHVMTVAGFCRSGTHENDAIPGLLRSAKTGTSRRGKVGIEAYAPTLAIVHVQELEAVGQLTEGHRGCRTLSTTGSQFDITPSIVAERIGN
jgi:hypothetical protein